MSDHWTEAAEYAHYAPDLGGLLCDECMGDEVLEDGSPCPVCHGSGVVTS